VKSANESRPKSVSWGVGLLSLWVALQFAGAVVRIVRIDPAVGNAMDTLVIYSLGGIGGLIINGFLVYRINLGQNWARVTFFVLRVVALTFLVLFWSLWRSRSEGTYFFFLCIEILTLLIALCLLFTSYANIWFRRRPRVV
jgi:uncharacterized membrane protein SirB2